MIGVVVDSILESTPEAVARRLAASPRAAALVEIRADRLRALDVAGLIRRSERPVVATVRGPADGGSFDGSVEEKRAILEAALGAGAAFVDVEWEGPLRDLASGVHAPRTIVSHHGAPCASACLDGIYEGMAGTKAARLKIVPKATRPRELAAVRGLLARARRERRLLCSFALGAAGSFSRVTANLWGSWGVYGAAARGRETADAQLTTSDLLEVYRVTELSESTTWFGLCGAPLAGSPSPTLHAAGYREEALDAVYLPIEATDLEDIASVLGETLLPLAGFGVTIPLKEAAAARCRRLDEFAASGAANTVLVGGEGWEGYNTDAPAALELIRKHVDPAGAKVAVVGAGGTARAVAAALSRAGSIVTLYGRSAARAEAAARAIEVLWAPIAALPTADWDLLVQATPLGRGGEEFLLRRHLNGRMVLDAAYGAEPTPLVRAARARGLAVADGFELLGEQALLQFTRLTGRPAPRGAMSAALESWRAATA